MNGKKYKYIYGPVFSWRLARSLGIDPVSDREKICSFDCIYCQLGKTNILTDKRKIFVATNAIIKELNSFPPVEIDYITFAGRGEPTLAKNLGDMIREVRKIRKEKIAVLTNSSLMHKEDVCKDLMLADFVIAKLDAPSQSSLERINHPIGTVKIDTIIRAIKNFKKRYSKKLALQIMFIEENKTHAQQIARVAKEIGPDEVQINTPLRPCPVKPLSKYELAEIESHFDGLKTVSVYNAKKTKIEPISGKDTLKRRGKV